MSKYHSVTFNFIMNFMLTISNFIFPLITFPYASRILGASGIGTVTFATSIIAYFSMIGMMGIPTYGIRVCAKVRNDQEKLNQTVQEIMVLNGLTMMGALVLLYISVLLIPKLADEKMLYLLMSSTLVFNVLGVDWLYKSLEKYTYITIRSILFKLLSLGLLFWLVKTSDDYIVYGLITVFAAVGANLLNFLHLSNVIKLKKVSTLNLKRHLKPALTFFLLTVSTTIYTNVDTTMLGFIKGDMEVGYYSAAVKIKQILVSIVTSLGAVLLPRLSFYYGQGYYKKFEALVQKAVHFVVVLSVPLFLYFMVVAEESILFLSGEQFLPAILPMKLLLPSVLFIGLSNLMGIQILVPTDRERLVVISTILGAVVDVLLNVVAIPLYSAAGAAMASSVAECSVVLIQLYYLKDLLLPMLRKIELWKIILSVLFSVAATMFIINVFSASVFTILLLTATTFFIVYALSLLVLKDVFFVEIVHSVFKKIYKS